MTKKEYTETRTHALNEISSIFFKNKVTRSVDVNYDTDNNLTLDIKLNLKEVAGTLDAKIFEFNDIQFFYSCEGEPAFFYKDIFEDDAYIKDNIYLPENAVIFDVGANIGYFSMHVCRKAKNAFIYAFEPGPAIYKVLSLNALNLDMNMKLFNIGLSDKNYDKIFTYYPNSSALSTFYENSEEEYDLLKAVVKTQLEGIKTDDEELSDYDTIIEDLLKNRLDKQQHFCSVKTISSILAEENIEYIDLLKIDAEKSEFDIILGIEGSDFQKIGQVIVEIHEKNDNINKILKIFESNGFMVKVSKDSNFKDTIMSSVYAINKNYKDMRISFAGNKNTDREMLKALFPLEEIEVSMAGMLKINNLNYIVDLL